MAQPYHGPNSGRSPNDAEADWETLRAAGWTVTVSREDSRHVPGTFCGLVACHRSSAASHRWGSASNTGRKARRMVVITACQAPCDLSTGVAYPLANGSINFDSGELGNAGPPTAGRVTWQVPANLPPGTYTYFCRIHPFMRGAFRVTASS